jgi:hypothetical protein
MDDEDGGGLVGRGDKVLDGQEALAEQDAGRCDGKITSVVANPRQGRIVRILRGEYVTQEESHEGRVDVEVIVRPLHLPEEGFEEGGEGEEGEDGAFDRAERCGRGLETGETEEQGRSEQEQDQAEIDGGAERQDVEESIDPGEEGQQAEGEAPAGIALRLAQEVASNPGEGNEVGGMALQARERAKPERAQAIPSTYTPTKAR